MKRKGMTINEAAHAFVSEMNTFPLGMIQKLFELEPDDWMEVTPPSINDRVYVYDECCSGTIVERKDKDGEDIFVVELDCTSKTVECTESDIEAETDSYFPMWGWMWQFNDSSDDWWLEERDGIKMMADCGFRIYRSEEFGYFFGIDGAGYDFYESHWMPLYKARGLKWHDEEDEEAA